LKSAEVNQEFDQFKRSDFNVFMGWVIDDKCIWIHMLNVRWFQTFSLKPYTRIDF
jgi:hypothetical protein